MFSGRSLSLSKNDRILVMSYGVSAVKFHDLMKGCCIPEIRFHDFMKGCRSSLRRFRHYMKARYTGATRFH